MVKHADAIMIEANHCPIMVSDSVQNGEISKSTAERIMVTHLRNERVGAFLANVETRAKVAVLVHLSADRNTPERAREVVQGALDEVGREMQLVVSTQEEPTEVIEIVSPSRKRGDAYEDVSSNQLEDDSREGDSTGVPLGKWDF